MSMHTLLSRFAIVVATSVVATAALAEDRTDALVDFLKGRLVASGKVSDYLARSTRDLKVDIVGSTEADVLKVHEDAAYSDGEKRKYNWRFTKVGEGRYVGHRPDVIGDAQVICNGNRIDITYKAREPMKDGTTQTLNFAETFEITSKTTANFKVNVSLMFVPVADASLTIRKVAAAASR